MNCRFVTRKKHINRKLLKCPHCGKRLTDMNAKTRVELYQHPIHVDANCQLFIKCFCCGYEIGIIVV